MRTYIGVDNGPSGTIAIISNEVQFQTVPSKKEQDYTKKKKNITRLDADGFKALLEPFAGTDVFLLMERPMVNPTRFAATESALRCLEAELIIIELLKIPYQFCDSKEWQRVLLPKGCDDTKKASLDIGNRLFPQYRDYKHPDRDGLLIAEYARRSGL